MHTHHPSNQRVGWQRLRKSCHLSSTQSEPHNVGVIERDGGRGERLGLGNDAEPVVRKEQRRRAVLKGRRDPATLGRGTAEIRAGLLDRDAGQAIRATGYRRSQGARGVACRTWIE